MTPLRLAIDVGPLYGHRTGVGTAVAGIVAALDGRADVSLEPYLVSRRATLRDGHRRLPLPGIVASHLWSRGRGPTADRWLRDADVLHGTNYVAPPSSLPTVVSVYDCWFLRHPELASPVVRRAGATLRRAVERGAWVHASSDATADEVRSLLGTDRVRTVFLGAPAQVERDEATPPPLASELGGRHYVVAIATEERRKGLPLLVEAFEHLAGDHHDLLLVLAGAPGDDSPGIDRLIADAGSHTRARIHRLGPVDEPTKRWLVRHGAVLAYPSLDEGFGFPILEAQAAGTPVVATRVGSIPEIAGDAAFLVEDRDAMTLAEAIDHVLSDGAARLGLIEAGYRNTGRFRWATTADRLLDLYRTAAA
ncbi:MAG: glycosyltransferase family 1 protein [Ilumatobacter sp.]|uniref:glycosyltransferase family 4 protein n=1 Tax=Ilumatobacter sp. TaxID=1967498 RepID=UPI002639C704|nr:glycosyltransferase family 1 protein [Ilumatobacter sp.]MDJ0770500.1 glycosyltransferase family 1 protein [Ilumatobacter sp.]